MMNEKSVQMMFGIDSPEGHRSTAHHLASYIKINRIELQLQSVPRFHSSLWIPFFRLLHGEQQPLV